MSAALAAVGGGTVVLLILALIIFGPFLSIWSLNTLFGLGIAYTFKTWIAIIIAGVLVRSTSYSGSK